MVTDRYRIPNLVDHGYVDAIDDLTLVTWRHFSRPATPSSAANAMRRRVAPVLRMMDYCGGGR